MPDAIYDIERTTENAPDEVKERGGVALSMWMTGAGKTDCLIVAGMSRRAEQLDAALAEAQALIETAERDGYVGLGWREDARRWATCWADVLDA